MEKDTINSTYDKVNQTHIKFPYVKLPKNCECTNSEGIGPFVTHATIKNPEGELNSLILQYFQI